MGLVLSVIVLSVIVNLFLIYATTDLLSACRIYLQLIN